MTAPIGISEAPKLLANGFYEGDRVRTPHGSGHVFYKPFTRIGGYNDKDRVWINWDHGGSRTHTHVTNVTLLERNPAVTANGTTDALELVQKLIVSGLDADAIRNQVNEALAANEQFAAGYRAGVEAAKTQTTEPRKRYEIMYSGVVRHVEVIGFAEKAHSSAAYNVLDNPNVLVNQVWNDGDRDNGIKALNIQNVKFLREVSS